MTPNGERHHSVHPSTLWPEHGLVDWRPERPRTSRVRVKEHTCDCLATFYELCQAGGLMFVRRTERRNGVTVVHESPWEIASRTQELWRRLLAGTAR
ncbi:hypothetical protein [Streptosporangium sandarakinum]|uniref:Uncharacterized protein n=1 Tax=Streptosporangium sandarakinum TaxID=1260955 RepID=A0A852V0B0_9ACTN|nr:hypothetical protein [Streptosporangium sandarakinum]NYF39235.1 hypothetical protein [Streptosporangium sandarakinum]